MQVWYNFEENSIGASIGTGIWYFLCIVSLLLVCVEIAVFIRTMIRTHRPSDLALVGFQLAIGFFLYSFLAYSFYFVHEDQKYNDNMLMIHLFECPVYWFFCLEVALAGLCILILYAYYRRRKDSLSRNTVMETLNSLSVGLCVCDVDGAVFLSNNVMNTLYQKLAGGNLTDAKQLAALLRDKGKEQDADHSVLVRLEEGQVWQFNQREIKTGSETLYQITASDMTMQQAKAHSLELKNRHLSEVQQRLKTVSAEERSIVALRERSRAKTTVHNQMGNVLLVGKYYLDHPENTREEELLQLLSYNNQNLIQMAGKTKETKDPIDAALVMAERIGLKVRFDGEKPEEPGIRKVLAEAIRQCAANAVRHAGADEMNVEIRRPSSDAEWQIRITNNGLPPKGQIRPGGGLGALARSTAEAGGSMELSHSPAFELKLRL